MVPLRQIARQESLKIEIKVNTFYQGTEISHLKRLKSLKAISIICHNSIFKLRIQTSIIPTLAYLCPIVKNH